MATQNIGPFRPYKTFSGGPPFRMAVREAASQTFTVGAVLIASQSTGYLSEGGADPTRILGVAEEPGHNVSSPGVNDVIHFAAADDDTLFVGNVSTGQVTALTDIGANFGITKVGNNWTIDKTKATTSRRVIVIDLDPLNTVGDTQGRLIFKFIDNFTALASTS